MQGNRNEFNKQLAELTILRRNFHETTYIDFKNKKTFNKTSLEIYDKVNALCKLIAMTLLNVM